MNQNKPLNLVEKTVTPVSFHPTSLMESTLRNYGQNRLFIFLCEKLGRERTEECFGKYHIGTAKNNGTVFWLVDNEKRVRGGKVILYDGKGHRVKGTGHDVQWAHSLMRIKNFNFKSCYFGEHLLNTDINATIAMVESEKTAVVASAFIPDCTWIATGGLANGFSKEQLSLLRGRNVVLFPDLNGLEKWRGQLEKMNAMGIHASIFDGLEQLATEEERQKGLDIADFLLETDSKEALLQRMFKKNPATQLLFEKLSLEIV